MSNKIYYIAFTIVLIILLGIYANSVRKISFLSDSHFKCIIKGQCPDSFLSNVTYNDIIMLNPACKALLKKYSPKIKSSYGFFTYYMKMVRELRNDMLLKKFKGEYVSEVMINNKIVSSIHFSYDNRVFHLKNIKGICEIFNELECILQKDSTYSSSLLYHLDSKDL